VKAFGVAGRQAVLRLIFTAIRDGIAPLFAAARHQKTLHDVQNRGIVKPQRAFFEFRFVGGLHWVSRRFRPGATGGNL
jgi:hypothetical protein